MSRFRLLTFGANAKSDWPRAAMEREGGIHSTAAIPIIRPFAALRVNGGVGGITSSTALAQTFPALRERGQNAVSVIDAAYSQTPCQSIA